MTNAGIADSVNKVNNFVTGWHELKRDTDASAVAGGWLPVVASWTAISRRAGIRERGSRALDFKLKGHTYGTATFVGRGGERKSKRRGK